MESGSFSFLLTLSLLSGKCCSFRSLCSFTCCSLVGSQLFCFSFQLLNLKLFLLGFSNCSLHGLIGGLFCLISSCICSLSFKSELLSISCLLSSKSGFVSVINLFLSGICFRLFSSGLVCKGLGSQSGFLCCSSISGKLSHLCIESCLNFGHLSILLSFVSCLLSLKNQEILCIFFSLKLFIGSHGVSNSIVNGLSCSGCLSSSASCFSLSKLLFTLEFGSLCSFLCFPSLLLLGNFHLHLELLLPGSGLLFVFGSLFCCCFGSDSLFSHLFGMFSFGPGSFCSLSFDSCFCFVKGFRTLCSFLCCLKLSCLNFCLSDGFRICFVLFVLELICGLVSCLLSVHLRNHPSFVFLVLLLSVCGILLLFSLKISLHLHLISFNFVESLLISLGFRSHLHLKIVLKLFVHFNLSLIGEVSHISSNLGISQGTNIITEASFSCSWQWIAELIVVAHDIGGCSLDLSDCIS